VLRSAVILLEDGQLALIRLERAGRVYYLLPGGGVEPGETLVEAARREAEEELGLRVTVGRLVAEVLYHDNRQFYFLARRAGGEFGSGISEEMIGWAGPEAGTYQAVGITGLGIGPQGQTR
jgi:8-oxo-dGTP diphosphatase